MFARYYASLVPVSLLFITSACFVAVTRLQLSEASILLGWYITCVFLIMGLCTLLLRLVRRGSALAPRVMILASFGYWLLTIYLQTNQDDVAVAYFGAQLEASALLCFALIVCFYIYTTFAKPVRIHKRLFAAVSVAVTPVVLLSHTALNQVININNSTATITTNVVYIYAVLLAGALLLITVLAIPLGRRIYPQAKSLSIPNLSFTTPQNAHDCNILDIVTHVVESARRQALRRGQWISYRPELFTAKGMIETQKLHIESQFRTLLDFALHTTPDNAVTIGVLPDEHNKIVHVSVGHTATKTPALPYPAFKTEVAELGGAITLQKSATETTYILSFPIHL